MGRCVCVCVCGVGLWVLLVSLSLLVLLALLGLLAMLVLPVLSVLLALLVLCVRVLLLWLAGCVVECMVVVSGWCCRGASYTVHAAQYGVPSTVAVLPSHGSALSDLFSRSILSLVVLVQQPPSNVPMLAERGSSELNCA